MKEGDADSAGHIKVNDVTYQGLAGVCGCMCIPTYVCMCVCFWSMGAMSLTWRVLGGYRGRLMEVVRECAIRTSHAFVIWKVRWVCMCVGRGRLDLSFS